ncbi:MAG: endolytic transglycosylase MltG [Patescibacteria group bacterium]
MSYSLLKPKKHVWKIIVTSLVVALIVAGLTVYGARYVYVRNLKSVSASEKIQLVTIPSGVSVQETGIILKQAGLVRQSWAFEWYMRQNNLSDIIQAGTYALRPNMSIQEIAKIITKGQIATDLFTILPGQRIDQVKQVLVNVGYSVESADAALNPAQYKDHPVLAGKPSGANLEGYLYPESFQRTTSTKPQQLIRASLDEMHKRLTPTIRSRFAEQGLSVYQGVILASIIEQEVGKTEDKAKVAQVFLLRIKRGMPLGSDPTAFYGALLAGQKPSVIYDSPYNTRLHAGFPPGPISNVSQSSLDALANPTSGDFLYFVAGDDGITHFSHTLAEHEALTAKYCKKLCSE